MKFQINFPVIKCYSSQYYGLIIEDSKGIIHYWDFNGNYDGYCCPENIDLNTHINKN